MKPKRFLFYISGHGFGHAKRSLEIIAALKRRLPGIVINVRTSAPASLFNLPGVTVSAFERDFSIIEREPPLGSLSIDQGETIRQLSKFLELKPEVMKSELEFIRENPADVILTDISFLACAVAHTAGLPCIGISNFTWDWIVAPMLQGNSFGESYLELIRSDYRKMTHFLKLNFSHAVSETFGEGAPVPSVHEIGPLVCQLLSSSKVARVHEYLRNKFGEKPIVFIASRDQIPDHIIQHVAATNTNFGFSYFRSLNDLNQENIAILDRSFAFDDAMGAAQIVVSKLGFSLLSNCIANGKKLCFPTRFGFREDELLRPAAFEHLACSEIQQDLFIHGHWGESLRLVARKIAPENVLRTDGAGVCAELIADFVN